jgi:hypothetical protein
VLKKEDILELIQIYINYFIDELNFYIIKILSFPIINVSSSTEFTNFSKMNRAAIILLLPKKCENNIICQYILQKYYELYYNANDLYYVEDSSYLFVGRDWSVFGIGVPGLINSVTEPTLRVYVDGVLKVNNKIIDLVNTNNNTYAIIDETMKNQADIINYHIPFRVGN